MSDRIEVFDIAIPAGTLITSPQSTEMSFQDGRIDRLEIRVPPGPSGLVGFRIAHSGQAIIPRSGTTWIVTDNVELDWDLDNYPTGGSWAFVAYNRDVYEHTIQVRMHITELGQPAAPIVVPIPIEPLAESEDFDPIPEIVI